MNSAGRVMRWLRHPALAGVLALLWLILRSGRKPDRLAYPCQQAALGTVSFGFILPLAYGLRGALTGHRVRRPRLAGVALAAGLMIAGVGGSSRPVAERAHLDPPPDYVATVYAIADAGGPDGDHHLGVDDLIACMGSNGLKLYRSPVSGPEQGPDGVVHPADVVLVKVNQQWSERGGTNTDVLRGLIARLLEHPDGFTGEVVVVENTQGFGTLDWAESNAEDHSQSVLDVVNDFASRGDPVSAFLWDDIAATSVSEYSEGDSRDGYVVGDWQPQPQIRVSYPKFRTAGGHSVSLKYGIWDPTAAAYDPTRLRFINVPVLKTHVIYGVTSCVKHQMGSMTTLHATNAHAAVRYGGLGAFLAQVRMPDLNILDGIYILANPTLGPSCSYENATRVDRLVAGLDPVAIDLWATTNILVPAIIENGYTQYPKQDPEDPASAFRVYLDATTYLLLATGIEVTNRLEQIQVAACGVTGLDDRPEPSLGHAHPNPFTRETSVRFGRATSENVRLEIYDVNGRLLRTVREPTKAGSPGSIVWEGADDSGRQVAPGVYYYRLIGAGNPVSGRVTMLD